MYRFFFLLCGIMCLSDIDAAASSSSSASQTCDQMLKRMFAATMGGGLHAMSYGAVLADRPSEALVMVVRAGQRKAVEFFSADASTMLIQMAKEIKTPLASGTLHFSYQHNKRVIGEAFMESAHEYGDQPSLDLSPCTVAVLHLAGTQIGRFLYRYYSATETCQRIEGSDEASGGQYVSLGSHAIAYLPLQTTRYDKKYHMRLFSDVTTGLTSESAEYDLLPVAEFIFDYYRNNPDERYAGIEGAMVINVFVWRAYLASIGYTEGSAQCCVIL